MNGKNAGYYATPSLLACLPACLWLWPLSVCAFRHTLRASYPDRISIPFLLTFVFDFDFAFSSHHS
jgi:hypothetical protein